MTKKLVSTCIQCEEDALLEVRKAASELHSIMAMLSEAYGNNHKPGTSVKQFVAALIETEKDHSRQRVQNRLAAQNVVAEADKLIAALRFIMETMGNSESRLTDNRPMRLDVYALLNTAINRIRLLTAGERGLLDGDQKHNERDFLLPLWKEGTR